MSEIETRIADQKNRAEKYLLRILDILDFLDENSPERMVLELRFIDCNNWWDIEKAMHLSRRACFNYQNKALDKLLKFKKIRVILNEYKNGDK